MALLRKCDDAMWKGAVRALPFLFLICIFVAAQTKTTTPGGMPHYASPNGSPSGAGSMDQPWDLQTALNQPPSVKPGDTIWLRGGIYGNDSGTTQYTSHLTGTSAQPIYVREYPGERATIDGGLAIYGPYTWYWGFEVTNSDKMRTTGRPRLECIDTYPGSAGVKIINTILHDCMEGIGFWVGATDADLYGNLIYFNGQAGTPRGYGHGIYSQNDTGTKHILDNIVWGNFDINMQFYGSGNAFVRNYDLDGNVSFNAGSLYGSTPDNVIFAGGAGLDNITVKNTYAYDVPSGNSGYSRLGWEFGGQNGTLTETGNYWIGGQYGLQMWGWKNITATGNVYYSDMSIMLQLNPTGNAITEYSVDRNRYYGSGLLNFNDKNRGFDAWKAATGLDTHSRFIPGRPTGVWSFVRPNQYEAGRANVIIYNWDLSQSVLVDVSAVLNPGDKYSIIDAENFFGPPVASGRYTGKPIAIPMTGLTVAQPVGQVPHPPVHTAPEFGVFILFRQ